MFFVLDSKTGNSTHKSKSQSVKITNKNRAYLLLNMEKLAEYMAGRRRWRRPRGVDDTFACPYAYALCSMPMPYASDAVTVISSRSLMEQGVWMNKIHFLYKFCRISYSLVRLL